MLSPVPFSLTDRFRGAVRRTGSVPWILFAFALAVRALYLYHIERCPYFDFMPPFVDQHNFYAGAKAFAEGDPWAPSANEMYSALYKYALGVVWWAAGGGDPAVDEYPVFLAARATHLFFGAIASVILYFEAARYFSRRIGITSSILYTLCGPLLFHEALLSREFPATWLSLASFAALGRLQRKPSWRNLLLSAGLLSLTYQCRTNAILFVPFIVWFVWSRSLAGFPAARRVAWIGAAGLLFALLCLPLAWRNSHRLPLTNPPPPGTERNPFTVSAQGPFEVALGNHPDLTAPGYRPVPEAIEFMEKGPLTMTGAARKIWGWFSSDLPGFALLYLRKIYWFFSDYEVPDNHSFYVWRWYSPLLDLPTSHAALYAALAIPGAFLAWRDRRHLALLYLFALAASLSVILTYIASRFRIQAIPFWIPFAAFALDRLWEFLRARRIIAFAALATAILALMRLFWLPEPDAVLRRLMISERHAPEESDGTVRMAHPDRSVRREIPYTTAGANRIVDLMNIVESYLFRLRQAELAPEHRPDRTAAWRRDAEECIKLLWRRAESMRDYGFLPIEKLAAVYSLQWNETVRTGDASRMIAIGEKWLRADPGQTVLRSHVAFLVYRTFTENRSPDPDAIRRVTTHLAAAAHRDPGSGDLWAALSHVSLVAGDLPAARFFREMLAARAPDHPAIRSLGERIPERVDDAIEPAASAAARRLEEEGDALSAEGKKGRALDRYAHAASLAFGNARIRGKLAEHLTLAAERRGIDSTERARLEREAERQYEILLLVAPDDPAAHIGLAKLIRNSDPLRAVAHLKRALEINPEHPLKKNMDRGILNWTRRFRPE